MKHFIVYVMLICLFFSCEQVNPEFQEEAKDPALMHASMKKLTDVIVHDIFSPPQASRIYAYPSIAAYEVIRQEYPKYKSLAGQLTDLENIPQAEEGLEYCYPLASLKAFLKVGRQLIFSEDKIDAYELELLESFKQMQMPKAVFDRSLAYGEEVADHIIAWTKTDNYHETRTYPKYSIPEDPSKWQPTPPDYMDGIEPHWKLIRPFVLESSEQFVPPPPTAYDTAQSSTFFKETMEVYEALAAEDKDERLAIAQFWDCNPYVSHHKGHMLYATKKITPGGHWIGIAKISAEKAKADFMHTVYTYTLTSITLADAFISCWDEKYRSNLVRPETFINAFIDEDWVPALQTPPFPEHTSGHSVISRAAAVALTNIYGDNFAFDDTTEEEYGLPMRSFTSFYAASEEAAVSRLYGGIHYRPAIDYGVEQGQKVGEYIVGKLELVTK